MAISSVFYVKVSSDAGSKPIPVQSRDYTGLAGVDHAPDNLGRPYKCTAKDLDYPKALDTWLDTNKARGVQKERLFREMDPGRCFRIERRAFPIGPCMLLRQATEVKGKISFVFYIGLR